MTSRNLNEFMFRDNMGDVIDEAVKHANDEYTFNGSIIAVGHGTWRGRKRNGKFFNIDNLSDQFSHYLESRRLGIKITEELIGKFTRMYFIRNIITVVMPQDIDLIQDEYFSTRTSYLCKYLGTKLGIRDRIRDYTLETREQKVFEWFMQNKPDLTNAKYDGEFGDAIKRGVKRANTSIGEYNDRFLCLNDTPRQDYYNRYSADFNHLIKHCKENDLGYDTYGHGFIIDPRDIGVKTDIYYAHRCQKLNDYLAKIHGDESAYNDNIKTIDKETLRRYREIKMKNA